LVAALFERQAPDHRIRGLAPIGLSAAVEALAVSSRAVAGWG